MMPATIALTVLRLSGTVRTVGFACLTFGLVGLTYGQTAAQEEPVGATPSEKPAGYSIRLGLPVVPQKEPRPAEGTAREEQWTKTREGKDRAPVASLIDTLRGNDAAIEVVVGQGRLLTLKSDIASPKGTPVIAVGDPTIVEFNVLPNARMIRLVGQRVGITDISIVTADGQAYSFEVHVVYDLKPLLVRLSEAFPDAQLRLAQLRNQVLVEGQAGSLVEANAIVDMIKTYLRSAAAAQRNGMASMPQHGSDAGFRGNNAPQGGSSIGIRNAAPPPPGANADELPPAPLPAAEAAPEWRATGGFDNKIIEPQVVNLIRIAIDLEYLRAKLKEVFPDIDLKLTSIGRQVAGDQVNANRFIGDQVVVEGEVHNVTQVRDIVATVENYLQQVQAAPDAGRQVQEAPPAGAGANVNLSEQNPPLRGRAQTRVINLLRVPGVHQVMLQVRVAELNRTALRQIGTDILGVDPKTGSIFGTALGNATTAAAGAATGGVLSGVASSAVNSSVPTTAFGIFPSANFQLMVNAMRQNNLLSILAEPNLIALNGQQASFLAGGQFPVPVPQSGGTAGAPLVTIQWQKFGVQLDFIPYVLEDETIRLHVTPDVSSIDFSIGTSILGTQVPGLNERSATTTVEMREGQTLAIAGLLSVTLDAQTKRIPVLGDLPYIGPLFGNSSHQRVEKELLVLVTPHLVSPMDPCQVPALPTDAVKDPTDCEFYLKNAIEGHKDPEHSSTANWDQSLRCKREIQLEKKNVSGPVGFSQ